MVHRVDITYYLKLDGEGHPEDEFPVELVRDIIGCQKHLNKKWKKYQYYFHIRLNSGIDSP